MTIQTNFDLYLRVVEDNEATHAQLIDSDEHDEAAGVGTTSIIIAFSSSHSDQLSSDDDSTISSYEDDEELFDSPFLDLPTLTESDVPCPPVTIFDILCLEDNMETDSLVLSSRRGWARRSRIVTSPASSDLEDDDTYFDAFGSDLDVDSLKIVSRTIRRSKPDFIEPMTSITPS